MSKLILDANTGKPLDDVNELRYKANEHFPVQLPGEERASFLLRKWTYWLNELDKVESGLNQLQYKSENPVEEPFPHKEMCIAMTCLIGIFSLFFLCLYLFFIP
jgi:hypothetical protein